MDKPGSLKEAIRAAERSIRCVQKGHRSSMNLHRDGTHVEIEIVKDPTCDCDKENQGQ